jgi:hypothetical protein
MGRLESLESGAREAGHLEQDESVRQYALTKGGVPVVEGDAALKALGDTVKARHNRGALLATDRSLHVVSLGQLGFKSVKEEALEIPIGEVELSRSGSTLRVGRRGERALWVFDLPPYISKIKKLTRYVESRAEAQ